MAERLKEIEKRLAELEVLEDPLFTEGHALRGEKERIYAGMVKEIAYVQEWILQYEERRETIFLDLKSRGDPGADGVITEIYKCTGGSYHHSFLLEGDDDSFEAVKLRIDDGRVTVHFDSTEVFQKYASKFKIDTSKIGKTIKNLQDKIDVLERIADAPEGKEAED